MPQFHIRDGMHFVSYNSGMHMLNVGIRFAALPIAATILIVRPTASTPGDPTEEEVLKSVLSGIARALPDRKVAHAVVEDGSWSSLHVIEYVASLLGDAVGRGEEFSDAVRKEPNQSPEPMPLKRHGSS